MSYKILLADDSVTVQKIITLTFSDEGVDVLTVNNGNDAINRLQYMRPALVMADVSIPGRNGYEICEFVKNHPEMQNTPVILLVPAFETFDEERAARIGADYHLTKPFQSIRTLIATVKNLIERKEVPPVVASRTPSTPAAGNGDLVNGKSAKIEELLKRSTGALTPVESQADSFAASSAENDVLGEIPSAPTSTPSPVLLVTEIKDEFAFDADAPAVIISAPHGLADALEEDVLELDDVLPQLHADVSGTPMSLATADNAGEPQVPQSVIDEIVARVVAQVSAQLSAQLSRQLADELSERLTARLADVSDELAHRVAPQVAELLRPATLPAYRGAENLLEID